MENLYFVPLWSPWRDNLPLFYLIIYFYAFKVVDLPEIYYIARCVVGTSQPRSYVFYFSRGRMLQLPIPGISSFHLLRSSIFKGPVFEQQASASTTLRLHEPLLTDNHFYLVRDTLCRFKFCRARTPSLMLSVIAWMERKPLALGVRKRPATLRRIRIYFPRVSYSRNEKPAEALALPQLYGDDNQSSPGKFIPIGGCPDVTSNLYRQFKLTWALNHLSIPSVPAAWGMWKCGIPTRGLSQS